MNKIKIDGIVPVIPTPFTVSEEIDEEALERLVEFAVAGRVAAICLPAYGSEFYKLSGAERQRVVRIAVEQARGRVPVLAQSNHASAKVAAEIAVKNESLGADMISLALPRQFPIPETDMLRYAERVCRTVKRPVLLQDFNPGGVTIGPAFAKELQSRCANFLYVKLEEPMMGPKVRMIREATQDRLGILEGWGGLYIAELFDFGICGSMPGTAMCDLFAAVWGALKQERHADALDTLEKMMPLLSLSLQTWELFHFVEKRMLQARGVLSCIRVRDAQWTPSPEVVTHTDRLIERVLGEVERLEHGVNHPAPSLQTAGNSRALV